MPKTRKFRASKDLAPERSAQKKEGFTNGTITGSFSAAENVSPADIYSSFVRLADDTPDRTPMPNTLDIQKLSGIDVSKETVFLEVKGFGHIGGGYQIRITDSKEGVSGMLIKFWKTQKINILGARTLDCAAVGKAVNSIVEKLGIPVVACGFNVSCVMSSFKTVEAVVLKRKINAGVSGLGIKSQTKKKSRKQVKNVRSSMNENLVVVFKDLESVTATVFGGGSLRMTGGVSMDMHALAMEKIRQVANPEEYKEYKERP
jgi:hypothetical protein